MANYGTLQKGSFFFLFLLYQFFYNVISHFQGDVLKETAKVHFFLIFSAIIWRLIFVTISSQSVSEGKILTNPKRLEQKNNVMKVMLVGLKRSVCGQFFFSKRVGTIQWSRDRESPSWVNWSERIRHFEVARETGSRWLSKCTVGLFWGTHFQHGGNFAPKTVPQCTFSWQPSRPGLPRNLKVANIWEKMLTLWSNQQRSGVLWLSKTSPVLALIDSPWTRWSGLASQSV